MALVGACTPPPRDLFGVGGSVRGLAGSGLILQVNGGYDLTIPADATAFRFARWYVPGGAYAVTVLAQPTNPAQTCTVENGNGTMAEADVNTVIVTCSANAYALGGSVTGLTGTGLVLQLNGQNDIIPSGDGGFAFPVNVASGATYTVTVSLQPTSPTQTCTVANGTGTMGDSDVSNVSVTCSMNAYDVGGSVVGLVGSGLTLLVNGQSSLPVGGDGGFTFTPKIASGSLYTITVAAQPTNPTQTCTVANGTGTVGNADVRDAVVTCSTKAYALGGSITGLVGTGLVLQCNGQNSVSVSGNGGFWLAVPVASGSTYRVTVVTAPHNPIQTCDIANGTGTMGASEVRDVTVTCATASGTVSTLAGDPGWFGDADGTGSAARFDNPNGITVDGSGNLYVAEMRNHTIRKITPSGTVTTLAGAAKQPGSTDGTGAGARFYTPTGVAWTTWGASLYVADSGNDTIRVVYPSDGTVSTVAGAAEQFGSTDGPVSSARFGFPYGVATDADGNVYVADNGNSTIRKVSWVGASRVVTTLAGAPNQDGSIDGTGTAARFSNPFSVALDGAGNVYVADFGNHNIRKITPTGIVTTLAGVAGQPGSADGTGSDAHFNHPTGVAADGSGNVYVADSINNTIRKITPGGVVSTLAGLAGQSGSDDGIGTGARFLSPFGVAVDASGNLYVTDGNQTIRKIWK
jgi:sugar lactone lactonase YvrE